MDEKLVKSLNRAFPEMKWILVNGVAVTTKGEFAAQWQVSEVEGGFRAIMSYSLGLCRYWSEPFIFKCKRPTTALRLAIGYVRLEFRGLQRVMPLLLDQCTDSKEPKND